MTKRGQAPCCGLDRLGIPSRARGSCAASALCRPLGDPLPGQVGNRAKLWDGVGIPFNIIFFSFITESIILPGHEKFLAAVDNGERVCYNKSAESRTAYLILNKLQKSNRPALASTGGYFFISRMISKKTRSIIKKMYRFSFITHTPFQGYDTRKKLSEPERSVVFDRERR